MIRTGDEFCVEHRTRLVRFRALSDEGIAQDGTRRPFVWATPLRPLAGMRGLAAQMVVYVDRAAPAERVP